MALQDFDALVAEFLACPKVALRKPRWRSAGHPDYAVAKMRVGVPGSRRFAGRLVVTAHRVRLPPKYGFSLLFRGVRVLGLDVNPARIHRNLLTPSRVGGTHWQRWPKMDAEPDDREQVFLAWVADFLRAADVTTSFGVLSPPRGVQLRLLLDGDNSDGRRS